MASNVATTSQPPSARCTTSSRSPDFVTDGDANTATRRHPCEATSSASRSLAASAPNNIVCLVSTTRDCPSNVIVARPSDSVVVEFLVVDGDAVPRSVRDGKPPPCDHGGLFQQVVDEVQEVGVLSGI